MAPVIFWISLAFIVYTYIGYPCMLYLWSKIGSRPFSRGISIPPPMVSIVIAARNEEKHIYARLSNLCRQSYPGSRYQIILVSDGSTDGTVRIVKDFILDGRSVQPDNGDSPEVHLLELDENRGKPNAINLALNLAKGEIIVFADARQKFNREAIAELVKNFRDPSVGCASGELLFVDKDHPDAAIDMGFYWNFEKKVRRLESAVGSVAGATGAIYAIRKSLFSEIPEETLLDDVYIPMHIVMQGYRTVFDAGAVACDTPSASLEQEKKRKIRTLVGNYQLLKLMPGLLSPTQNPIFARYLSHKVFRLAVPFFFITLLLSAFMAGRFFYGAAFLAGLLLCFTPLVEKIFKPRRKGLSRLLKICRTFVHLNYYAVIALVYFILPGRRELW